MKFPYLPQEKWFWGQPNLPPKKKAPYALFKHICLCVQNSDNQVSLVRLVDLADKEKRPAMGNMVDVKTDHLQLAMLINILENDPSFEFNSKTHNIEFLHSLIGNRNIRITQDNELQYAVQSLRTHGSSKIQMICTSRR
jgi:hypothetical protein